MKDFFISYNSKDKTWAEWIALTLTNAGFTPVIQSWDFRPGTNFVLQMQQATIECKRTIAVLTPNWLASVFTQPEWAAAFALDPTGAARKLIPVRVQACEAPGLLRAIVHCDLVGLAEDAAKAELLRAASETPPEPPSFVPFPGTAAASQRFPGASRSQPRNSLPSTVKCAFDLFGLLQTTRTTFEAQARLRDALVRRIHDRLILNPNLNWQYEEFFSRHYSEMDDEEKRIFATIRSFTTSILSDYNRRILALIDACPKLSDQISSIRGLKRHLLVWLAKFEGTFLNTPSMCLLYVGVDEDVPFPPKLDRQVREYLGRQRKYRELLGNEPDPMEHFEEYRDEGEEWWRYNLTKKWQRKRLLEIQAERAQALSDLQISKSNQELTEFLVSSIGWRGTAIPAALISSLELLAKSPDPTWPEPLRKSLDSVRRPINEFNATPGIGSENLKLLFKEAPAITSQVQVLGIKSSLVNEWNRFCDSLLERAFADLPE